MSQVVIYTDGACRGNPGPGGWGAVLQYGEKTRELCGGAAETTNNRMELTAAIRALAALSRQCKVVVYTDSKYVRHGIEDWLPQWKRQDWRTASRKPVKNVDLWKELDTLVQHHDVEWRWVRGHAGNEGNEWADRLANQGLDEMLTGAGGCIDAPGDT